jgi:hypothetical protein
LRRLREPGKYILLRIKSVNADHRHTLGWVGLTDHPRFSTDPARTLLGMSDYEWLVELAAKGMAERDNHPMPKSVTTPEAFYEVMARAALDAVGLQALLEELARAEQELKNADEGPNLAVNADAATTLPEEPSVPPQYVPSVPPATHIGYGNGVLDTPSRRERGTGKAENARLRSK